MSFWQDNDFRIDPWGLDYEMPINLSEDDDLSTTDVNPHVETSDWETPLRPLHEPPLPSHLIFIDGRRRIDARLVGRNDNEPTYGAFATIAVGAVKVDRTTRTATYDFSFHQSLLPRRVIVFSSTPKGSLPPETTIPCPLGGMANLVYGSLPPNNDQNDEPSLRQKNDPKAPMKLVQQKMRDEEVELALEFDKQSNALVIQDGNLFNRSKPGEMLGYVKTMQKIYLPNSHAALLWKLRPGERTPIFELGEKSYSGRLWSWYLRSGRPEISPDDLGYHALHGLVRLELYAKKVSLDKAKEIANQTTYFIPEYASHPNRDPRAPQNLTPISALEKELGRRMGDQIVIQRRIQKFLASRGVKQ
jgi:uncharacterized protein